MFAVLFSVLLVASETTATTNTTPAAPIGNEAAQPAEDAGKKICKRQQVTGQIQGTKRVCMTAEQWKRVQQADSRRR